MIGGILYFIFALMQLENCETLVEEVGFIILSLSGLALFFVGVFPENIRTLHTASAWLYFILFPIGAVTYTEGFFRRTKRLYHFRYTAYLTLVVFIIVVFFPWRNFDVTRLAIPEMIASTMYYIWHFLYVYHILYKKHH